MTTDLIERKDILAVVPPDFGPGLKLSGMRVLETKRLEDVQRKVESLLEEQSVGLLILANQFYFALPERVRVRLDESLVPMAVTLPDTVDFGVAPEDQRKIVSELIRRAIGFQIRVT